MGNTAFIVWRESIEAMLVVGVLYAWLRDRDQARIGLRFLWGGVVAGLGLALLLALVMLGVRNELAGAAMDYFQIGMMLMAATLITQMVLWMRSHGPTLQRDLEFGMERAWIDGNGWRMALLAAIAVGREGAETVIFLYGMGMARGAGAGSALYGGAALGFAAALLSFWLLSRGARWFSWRVFFRFSEAVLLLLASGLLVESVDRMIGMNWLPALLDPVWDTSALMHDGAGIGGLIASLTGYRARPALLVLLAYAGYWFLVFFLLRASRHRQLLTAAAREA